MGRCSIPILFFALAVASALAFLGCGGGSDPLVGTWVASEDSFNAGLSMEIVKTDGTYYMNTADGQHEPLAVKGDTLVGGATIVEGANVAMVHQSVSQDLLKTRVTLKAKSSTLNGSSWTYYWIRDGSGATAPQSKSLTYPEFQYITRIKAGQAKVRRVVDIADKSIEVFSKQPYFTDSQTDKMNEAIDIASGVLSEWNKLKKPSSRMNRLEEAWTDTLRHLSAFLNGLVGFYNKVGTTSKNLGAEIDEFLEQRDEAARGNHKTTRAIARLMKEYPPE